MSCNYESHYVNTITPKASTIFVFLNLEMGSDYLTNSGNLLIKSKNPWCKCPKSNCTTAEDTKATLFSGAAFATIKLFFADH